MPLSGISLLVGISVDDVSPLWRLGRGLTANAEEPGIISVRRRVARRSWTFSFLVLQMIITHCPEDSMAGACVGVAGPHFALGLPHLN